MKSTLSVLSEAKRLHRLGFAIIWLRKRSKIPLEAGWTTGPRQEWSYLSKTHTTTLNMGVRLGEPSRLGVGDRFLAVVDVDVKSTDKRHRVEALEAAKRLVGGAKCPTVLSGRGNGSMHLYCVTKAPFKTVTPCRSKEMVKVLMPSKKASKREIEELGPTEVAKGYRLSPAWETSLYSSGRQVVLPPSIHPDTGKAYTWSVPLESVDDFPLVEFDLPITEGGYSESKIDKTSPLKKKTAVPELSGLTFKDVDVSKLQISDTIKKGILTGKGVEDRSAFLLPACQALLSTGLGRDEVLSVLTDKKNYISACAFEHARTSNRERAAAWVWKFSLAKVMDDRDPSKVFTRVETREVDDWEKELVAEEESTAEGFYKSGKPDYVSLLRHFEEEAPYKTAADMKTVFRFDGTHYVDLSPIEIKSFAEENFSPDPTEKIRQEFLNKVFANNIVKREFFIRTTEGKINFKNGILDLESEELLDHDPEIGFRSVLPYDYDLEATCPRFESWIRSIMLNDKELIAVLQEFMGYIVRGGEYRFHKALWLEGVGRNGKSTFISVIKELIGHRNYSTASIKSLVGDKFANESLDGKIANFSEETSPQELADSGPFKNLTSGGDVFAQKKFGDIYSFRNRAKLIMSYNQIPDLKDLSQGMLSRPLIVPFRKKIKEEEQDRKLFDRLIEELPGIFNYAMVGWKRLENQNGFTRSVVSENALKQVREESCNVHQFVTNYVDFLPLEKPSEKEYRAIDIYVGYKNSERFPFRSSEFFRRLNRFEEIKKRKIRKNSGVFYNHIWVKM